MLEGSIAFTLSGATEFEKLGFGSLTITSVRNIKRFSFGKYIVYWVLQSPTRCK